LTYNIDTIDYLRAVYGDNIKIFVTYKSSIFQTIEKYYEIENVVKGPKKNSMMSRLFKRQKRTIYQS